MVSGGMFLLLENAESAEANRVATTPPAAPGKPTSTAEMLAPQAHSYPAPCLLAMCPAGHPAAVPASATDTSHPQASSRVDCPMSPGGSPCSYFSLIQRGGQHRHVNVSHKTKIHSLSSVLKVSTTVLSGMVRKDDFFPNLLSVDFNYFHIPWTSFTLSTDKVRKRWNELIGNLF